MRKAKRDEGITQTELLKSVIKENNNSENQRIIFRCTRCGFTTVSDVNKFPTVYSSLYKCNDYKLPICKNCIDDLYNNVYYPKYLDQNKAVRRICMIYDIYYDEELVKMSAIGARPSHLMTFYLQKTQLQQYANKTYDNTLDIEAEQEGNIVNYTDLADGDIPEDTIKFWGFGFSKEDYEYLDERYATWSACYDINTESMSTIFRNICMIELQILKGVQGDGKVEQLYNQLNNFMNSAGIQPKQSSDNAASDSMVFGVLIKKWEDNEPVPDPLPEWRDVDGIRRYITVYFLGHLCKMFGIKNAWSELYEEEIAKYTVNKPQITEENINQVSYEDIFGSDGDE